MLGRCEKVCGKCGIFNHPKDEEKMCFIHRSVTENLDFRYTKKNTFAKTCLKFDQLFNG